MILIGCLQERRKQAVFCFALWCEQVATKPPKSHNDSSEANEMTNDVQRDQSAAPSQKETTVGAHSLPATTASTPTDPPFISLPVTKTPGTSM